MRTNRDFYDYVVALPAIRRPLQPRPAVEYVSVRNSDARWYNAHVDGFLERGAEGAFHGWDAAGEDLEEMPFLTWDDLRQFLIQGQYNE